MGARPAVGVIHRRELAVAEDPEAERDRLAELYADSQLRPEVAAARGIRGRADRARRNPRPAGLGFQLTGARAMNRRSGRRAADRRHRVRRHGAAGALSGAQRSPGHRAGARRQPRGRPSAAWTRCWRTCSALRADEYRSRVEAVAADMTAPGLGLTRQERERLAERVTTIVHSAASVSFTLALEEAREINLEGTRRMLEFAELARRARRPGPATATSRRRSSPGPTPGASAECDIDVGQSFHNSYEQSKFEAEQLVRSHDGLPCTILRPSIVVGDRNNGWTAAFNVLYWPLRAFARGLFTAVPAIPSAPVDVVSIDYVADAAYALMRVQVRGRRHVSPDRRGRTRRTIGEIAGLASRYFRRPLPQVVPPAEFAELTLGPPSARRWTPAASTSPTSRWRRCSTTPRRGPGWSPTGSRPRRCATTWTACWTSPPAAAGASGRSRASMRSRPRRIPLRAAS